LSSYFSYPVLFSVHDSSVRSAPLDYSPFGQVAAEAVLWAVVAHLVWLSVSYFVFNYRLEPAVFMNLLSANPVSQAKATELVGQDFK
jgi:hypothetical protein